MDNTANIEATLNTDFVFVSNKTGSSFCDKGICTDDIVNLSETLKAGTKVTGNIDPSGKYLSIILDNAQSGKVLIPISSVTIKDSKSETGNSSDNHIKMVKTATAVLLFVVIGFLIKGSLKKK